jgi:hypothetical protein
MATYQDWIDTTNWDVTAIDGDTNLNMSTNLQFAEVEGQKKIQIEGGEGDWATGVSYSILNAQAPPGEPVDKVEGTLPDSRHFIIRRKFLANGAVLDCTIDPPPNTVGNVKAAAAFYGASKSRKSGWGGALPGGSGGSGGTWTAQEGSGGSGWTTPEPEPGEGLLKKVVSKFKHRRRSVARRAVHR